MAVSRAKLLSHRKKVADRAAIKLVQPMESLSVEPTSEKVREKVLATSKRSALVRTEGRTMGMDID